MRRLAIRKIKKDKNNITVFFCNGLYKTTSLNSNYNIYIIIMACFIGCSSFNCISYENAINIAKSLWDYFGYPDEFINEIDAYMDDSK